MQKKNDETEQEFILGNRGPFITHLFDYSPSTVCYEAPLQLTLIGQRKGSTPILRNGRLLNKLEEGVMFPCDRNGPDTGTTT